jgi:hypothetical protein
MQGPEIMIILIFFAATTTLFLGVAHYLRAVRPVAVVASRD